MNIISHFKKIVNLNWKKVKIFWIYEKEKRMILQIRWKYNNTTCPHCWFNTNKRKDKKLHKQSKILPHMPYWWDKMIFLELYKRYFRCINCNTQFYERFDFESKYWIYSNHFEQYIQWNWWHVSWNKLAELYQTSISVIYSILERIDINLINKRWLEIIEKLDEIYLWVDEHSFSSYDMVLVITELKTWKILAILDWITKEKLENWIWNIPLKHHKKIKWFSTDMNKWYADILKQIIWNPIFTVDKYHIFQEANRVMDEVRQISIWSTAMKLIKAEDIAKLWRKIPHNITKKDIEKVYFESNNEIMKKYKDKLKQRLQSNMFKKEDLLNSKWEVIEYKEITLGHFIDKWYRKLFLFREKNLSPIQKLRLNQIFYEFDYLGFLKEARTMKEDFFDAMDELDIERIKEIMNNCLSSKHFRIKKFGRTLKRWLKWIEWFCRYSTKDFKFTNALTESINNLCKVAKRVSHGFRTKSMYIKKLVAKFCLNELKI